MSNNIERTIFGKKGGAFSAWAWRREPDFPNWRVYVEYDAGGWDVEPAIYGEDLETAILEVYKAIRKMEDLRDALEAFQVEQIERGRA